MVRKPSSAYVVIFAVLSVATGAFGGVTVATSSDADALVKEILGTGVCVVPGSATYTGAARASGFFSGGLASGLGIESGIVLTSGNAHLAQAGNSSDSSTGDNGLPGDADLDAILPAGSVSYDATVLEFDHTGADLSFRYVFASEEYNEYANQAHSDIFCLFLDGVNIALVPGTDAVVSVNTVNGGGPAFGTDPSHPELFHNNDLHDGGPFFDFEYDGFTDVFTAEVIGLTTGTHHVKFTIADTGDRLGDSAVFVQTGTSSTQSAPVVLPVPGAAFLCAIGAGILGHLRRCRVV